MKKLLTVFSIFLAFGTLMFLSCKKESSDPPKVGIFYSIADKQVAFTALTKRVESWAWDFGDGQTSTQQNPVHVYDGGGYYAISLTGTDAEGRSEVAKDTIAVAVTPYVLLTGGASDLNGKTWKLSSNHSSKDKLANADADLTIADGVPPTLPTGVFGSIGMAEVYDDTYTFFFDGSYAHDTKADHAAFGGIVYEMITTGGAGIVNANGQDFGLCTGLYTPEAGATFTYTAAEDFVVPSVYGSEGFITFTDASTLDFSGTEFVGFMDNQRKVIIQDITDNTMRLVMFMAASPDYYPLNTHALVLTFEAVK